MAMGGREEPVALGCAAVRGEELGGGRNGAR